MLIHGVDNPQTCSSLLRNWDPHLIHGSLGPPNSDPSNVTLIGSASFAGQKYHTNSLAPVQVHNVVCITPGYSMTPVCLLTGQHSFRALMLLEVQRFPRKPEVTVENRSVKCNMRTAVWMITYRMNDSRR